MLSPFGQEASAGMSFTRATHGGKGHKREATRSNLQARTKNRCSCETGGGTSPANVLGIERQTSPNISVTEESL